MGLSNSTPSPQGRKISAGGVWGGCTDSWFYENPKKRGNEKARKRESQKVKITRKPKGKDNEKAKGKDNEITR